MRDYLKLHVVVLLWGGTASLGNLIDLSAIQVALYRSLLAALILFLAYPRDTRLSGRQIAAVVGNGMLLGLHWMLFFLAVKVANVSICMIGMATVAFWTSLLEPALVRSCRFQWVNLFLGLLVIFAVFLIYRTETEFHYGLSVALTASLVATVFSIINGRFAGKIAERSVVMYEMAGAAVFCGVATAIGSAVGMPLASPRWMLQPMEWVWLGLLVIGGTVIAYLMYVELLRRLSVFTINFANNLEPVYGIAMGALFFQDHRDLGGGFFAGTMLILAAVIAQPWLARLTSRRALAEAKTGG